MRKLLSKFSLALSAVGCLLLGACSTSQQIHVGSGMARMALQEASTWTWDQPSPMATSQAKGNPHYKVGRPYTVKGTKYYPQERFRHAETGIASWYGPGFHGRLTANGEIFDENKMTAAHKTLQLPCMVKVTNLNNGRVAVVRVNDRGPYHANRVIDLSKAAARELGFHNRGTARVRVEVLESQSIKLAQLAKQGEFPDHVHTGASPANPIRLAKKPVHIENRTIQLAAQNYALEIGGIYSPEKALEYHGELSKVGAVGIKEHTSNGLRHYALHMGPYPSQADAIKMAGYLRDLGHQPEVVRYNG